MTRRRSPQTNQTAFLAAYRACGSVTAAAAACGVERTMHYRWSATPEYVQRFHEAQEEASQILEDEAVERATRGTFSAFTFQGRPTYAPESYREDPEGRKVLKRGARPLGEYLKSDRLLEFLLKGFRPDKYRERVSQEISGPAGSSIEVTFVTPPVRE